MLRGEGQRDSSQSLWVGELPLYGMVSRVPVLSMSQHQYCVVFSHVSHFLEISQVRNLRMRYCIIHFK